MESSLAVQILVELVTGGFDGTVPLIPAKEGRLYLKRLHYVLQKCSDIRNPSQLFTHDFLFYIILCNMYLRAAWLTFGREICSSYSGLFGVVCQSCMKLWMTQKAVTSDCNNTSCCMLILYWNRCLSPVVFLVALRE